MKLKHNMCHMDRAVRVGIAVGLMYVGFVNTSLIDDSIINGILGAFGVLNLFSAALAHCPVYAIAGISTCSAKEEPGQGAYGTQD